MSPNRIKAICRLRQTEKRIARKHPSLLRTAINRRYWLKTYGRRASMEMMP